jgi:predicted peptidase
MNDEAGHGVYRSDTLQPRGVSTFPVTNTQMKNAVMQRKLKFQIRLAKRACLHCLLSLPEDYRATSRKRWPLLLFLHGAGERGTDLKLVTKHGPPKLAARGTEFPFLILSPQCPREQRWDDDALLALLDHVAARYRIDARRVYLTGLSMGGYGTWSLGTKYPERFAAIAPVCGGGSAGDILLSNRTKLRALRSLAVWAFHGARDDVVSPLESRIMVAALRKAGCQDVRLTVYPKTGHDSHTPSYENPKLYQWFLARHRQ